MIEHYEDKPNDYFSNNRKDIISFIGNKTNLKLVEIGAGNGATLAELKKTGVAKEIHAFDIVDVCNNKDYFNSFNFGNIEQDNLPFTENYFDGIILADVLEHLIDAPKAIKKLLPYLKNDGSIYISLPNIRYAQALFSIVFKGSFAYTDSGIFDRTHLRFFCKKDMKQLINSIPELKIDKVESNLKHLKNNKSVINKLTFGVFEEFLSLQYFLKVSLK